MNAPVIPYGFSDECGIFGRGLPVVASLIEWLPVRAIPEKGLVAVVRNDVIDNGSFGGDAVRPAENAKRVIREEGQSSDAPIVPVTACRSVWP
jgi:hypothetical protein